MMEYTHLAYIIIFWRGDNGPLIRLRSAVHRQSGVLLWEGVTKMIAVVMRSANCGSLTFAFLSVRRPGSWLSCQFKDQTTFLYSSIALDVL